MGSLWFAPTGFKRQATLGRFEGVYLPYWTFDSMTYCRWSGQRGDHYTVRRNNKTVRRTRWRRVSGSFQRFFDDVLALAARNVPVDLLRRLEPWPLEELVPFHAEFLAGFQARTYETTLEVGFEDARRRIDVALDGEVRARIGGDAQRIESKQVRYDAITYKHLLLPLWLLTYSYGNRRFQVVVNATTAEVHGERPWSMWKIFFLVLFIAIAVLLFLWIR